MINNSISLLFSSLDKFGLAVSNQRRIVFFICVWNLDFVHLSCFSSSHSLCYVITCVFVWFVFVPAPWVSVLFCCCLVKSLSLSCLIALISLSCVKTQSFSLLKQFFVSLPAVPSYSVWFSLGLSLFSEVIFVFCWMNIFKCQSIPPLGLLPTNMTHAGDFTEMFPHKREGFLEGLTVKLWQTFPSGKNLWWWV